MDSSTKDAIARRVEGGKWLLWHGKTDMAIERLHALRRHTGWAGARNPVGGLIKYLTGCRTMLVNYRDRRARRLAISSAGAEWVVDYVVGQRMKRNGHMRWTADGANSL